MRCRRNIGLRRCKVYLCLFKGNSRLLYVGGCVTAFCKSRIVGILCVCQFALRLLQCHCGFLRLFGISTILFNGCVVRNLCGFHAIHRIFHRGISLGHSCATSLYGFIVGNLCLFKVKLCRLRLCLCFCEFFHIHSRLTYNISDGSHRLDVLCHRFCECFGGYVDKLGGIHILLELVGCDACLGSSRKDIIGIGSTFSCHIHKGFSCGNGGGRYGCKGSGNCSGSSFTNSTECFKLALGIVCLLSCVLHLVAHIVGFFACVIHTFASAFKGIGILLQFALHLIERCFCVI